MDRLVLHAFVSEGGRTVKGRSQRAKSIYSSMKEQVVEGEVPSTLLQTHRLQNNLLKKNIRQADRVQQIMKRPAES